jgi:Holliday junction resolvase RusA-like endonuclease
MEPLTLRLPMPPSSNAAYANRKSGKGRGRVATKALLDWRRATGKALMAELVGIARRPVFTGLVDIEIKLPVPANGAGRDADNCVKAVPDLLKRMGVLIDDNWRYVRSPRPIWVYDGSLGEECEVTVVQIASEPATRPKGASRAQRGRKQVSAATGQRRPSQDALEVLRGSAKKPDAAFIAAVASRYRISESRVHLQGGMVSRTLFKPPRTAEAGLGATRQRPNVSAVQDAKGGVLEAVSRTQDF